MKFIDSSYRFVTQWNDDLQGIYNKIEEVGRICYKSIGTRYFEIPEEEPFDFDALGIDDDTEVVREEGHFYYEVCRENKCVRCLSCSQQWLNTNKDFEKSISQYEVFDIVPEYGCYYNMSARHFVEDVIEKNGHGAMLEHGTVYLKIPIWKIFTGLRYIFNKYSRCKVREGDFLITTNYRVIVEEKRKKDLKYLGFTPYHYRRHTVVFTMDRIGTQSVCRHRGRYGVSFAQESTRYCDYTKDKFGGELRFVIPRWVYRERNERVSEEAWWRDLEGEELVKHMTCHSRAVSAWYDACERVEKDYKYLRIDEELKAEEARSVLNFSLASDIAMTAFDADWKHFFDLRDDSHAHPDIQYIAHQLHNEHCFRNLR